MPKVQKNQSKVPNKHTLKKDTGLQLGKEAWINYKVAKNSSNTVENTFDMWTVKTLKNFLDQRGIPTTGYKKTVLIQLAKIAEETNLPVDPDFANDSFKACLEERLTVPASKQIPDPFKMTHLSKDMSSLPLFGLLDIFNHLIASKAEYDKELLAS